MAICHRPAVCRPRLQRTGTDPPPAQPMAGQQFLAAGAGDGNRPPDRRRPEDRDRRRLQPRPLVPDRPGRTHPAGRRAPHLGCLQSGRLFAADLTGWHAVADRVHDGRFTGRCGNAVLRAAAGALSAAGQSAAHFRLGRVDLRDGAAGQHAQRTHQRYRCSAGSSALARRRHRSDSGRDKWIPCVRDHAAAGSIDGWSGGRLG